MKTQIFLLLALGIFLLSACQETQNSKQYFEECAEIDLTKKLIDAYHEQDWATFRSCYSDTARIWKNVWYTSDPGVTIDESITEIKENAANIFYYKYEETVWEMIIDNEGNKWVHLWGKWVAKFTSESDKIVIPAHIAFGVVGDKVVYEAGFWDNLPLFLALPAPENQE